jgi:hypothetical protein
MTDTGIPNGAGWGGKSGQAPGVRRRAYCASIHAALSLSSIDARKDPALRALITFFAMSPPTAAPVCGGGDADDVPGVVQMMVMLMDTLTLRCSFRTGARHRWSYAVTPRQSAIALESALALARVSAIDFVSALAFATDRIWVRISVHCRSACLSRALVTDEPRVS